MMLLGHITKNGCVRPGSTTRLLWLEKRRFISSNCSKKIDLNKNERWYHRDLSQNIHGANSRLIVLMSCMVAVTSSYWNSYYNTNSNSNRCLNESLDENEKKNDSGSDGRPKKALIETDLLDKLAGKPYVHYHNSATMEDVAVTNVPRPKGIPKRVRVLVVDVPEFRDVFSDGECRVNLSRVFADAIAPTKKINLDDKDNDQKTKQKLEIPQKILATALVRCRKNNRIGIELLEASIMDLNPNNLRRIYNFGGYQYDPGKYTADPQIKTTTTITSDSGPADVDIEEEMETKTNDDSSNHNKQKQSPKLKKIPTKSTTSKHVNPKDEMEAPWNQYAWIEEIYIRVHGLVPFGAPLESAPLLSRLIFGRAYKRTVPSSRGYISYFVPSIFLSSSYTNSDGIDGDYRIYTKDEQQNNIVWNRASCKPHAVIVNGAAMQYVPGSLRYLTKCCREANVPLFVVNDPRVWGATTHASLEDAARAMRTVIKRNILQNALSIKEGNMFQRGREVGRFETNVKRTAQDVSRKTRQAVQDARIRYKRSQEDDWSKLNSEQLLTRLMEHKVITSVVLPDQSNSEQPETHEYTEALLETCQLILQKQAQKQNSVEKSESSVVEDDATSLN